MTPALFLVLSPVDWIRRLSQLHYVIGALSALSGALLVLFADRALSARARRRHDLLVTLALNEALAAASCAHAELAGAVVVVVGPSVVDVLA